MTELMYLPYLTNNYLYAGSNTSYGTRFSLNETISLSEILIATETRLIGDARFRLYRLYDRTLMHEQQLIESGGGEILRNKITGDVILEKDVWYVFVISFFSGTLRLRAAHSPYNPFTVSKDNVVLTIDRSIYWDTFGGYPGNLYSTNALAFGLVVGEGIGLNFKIGDTIRETDKAWVKVDGQLREVDKVWTKVNNALREV